MGRPPDRSETQGHSDHGRVFPAGVVEGFYGPPWTQDQRLWMIRFIASVGMNTYIYAPKDDPLHRERWREPYEGAAAARLRELTEACRAAGVAFNFAVSPGLAVTYGSRSDRRLLADKFLVLADEGAAAFSLFLDDIPEELQDGSDRQAFDSLAQAQAELANEVRDRIEKGLGKDFPLVLCPTEYIGTRATPYLETLGRELDPRIDVMWTGPRVVSPTITCADARAFGAAIGRKPYVWDNYPVNDFAPNRMFCGPLRGREPGLASELSGYVANPMNQALASQIALRTVADFLRDGGGYDPEQSWKRAVRSSWSGDELADEFAAVSGLLAPSPLDVETKTSLSRAAAENDPAPVRHTLDAAVALLTEAGSSPLIVEMSGWINDMVLRCRTVLAAREAAEALAAGDDEGARDAAREAWRHRTWIGRRHTLSSGDEIEAAEKVLLPLLRGTGEILFTHRTSGESGRREEVLLDQDTAQAAGQQAEAQDDTVSVILDAGEPLRAERIVAAHGKAWRRSIPEDPPELAVSLDGATFAELPAKPCGAGVVAEPGGMPFRFVRITGRDGIPVFAILERAAKAGDANP